MRYKHHFTKYEAPKAPSYQILVKKNVMLKLTGLRDISVVYSLRRKSPRDCKTGLLLPLFLRDCPRSPWDSGMRQSSAGAILSKRVSLDLSQLH